MKSYFVALGSNPVGDKQRAGDQRTPEGLFHVNAHNPASKFHLALRISYPDDAHRARAPLGGIRALLLASPACTALWPTSEDLAVGVVLSEDVHTPRLYAKRLG